LIGGESSELGASRPTWEGDLARKKGRRAKKRLDLILLKKKKKPQRKWGITPYDPGPKKGRGVPGEENARQTKIPIQERKISPYLGRRGRSRILGRD